MAYNTKKALPDHESDPAQTPGDGWVGEGGASSLGPATHTAAGRDGEGEPEGEDAIAGDAAEGDE